MPRPRQASFTAIVFSKMRPSDRSARRRNRHRQSSLGASVPLTTRSAPSAVRWRAPRRGSRSRSARDSSAPRPAAFVHDRWGGITLFDVSNPAMPRREKTMWTQFTVWRGFSSDRFLTVYEQQGYSSLPADQADHVIEMCR